MAAKFKDYYKLLGIERTASAKEIKSSYRKLAREHHPDLHAGSSKKAAEEKFKEINEAYEVLGDAEKRKKYDTLGNNWQEGQDWQPQQGAGGAQYRTWTNDDASAFGSSGFSDFFESLFGGGVRFKQGATGFTENPHRSRQLHGQDLESILELTLEEAYHGGEKLLQLSPRDVRLQVKIPVGVQEGSKIRLKGQGEESFGGGRQGDLLLKITFKPHAIYKYKDHDLEVQLKITPVQAVVGEKMSVPTLDGEINITIPPMTHSGQKFRLRGKGWPKKDGERGDEYVKIIIDIPKKLSPEEIELYHKLAQLKSPTL